MEEPYIKALELEEKDANKMRGRGEIRIVQKVPLPRGNEDKHIRNEFSYKARRCLKQARRCEQIVYRLKCTAENGGRETPEAGEATSKYTGGRETPGSSEATRQKLNDDAMKLLLKDGGKGKGWEAIFREKLAGIQKNKKANHHGNAFVPKDGEKLS